MSEQSEQGVFDVSQFAGCIGKLQVKKRCDPYCYIALTDNGISIRADPRVELKIEIPRWMFTVEEEE